MKTMASFVSTACLISAALSYHKGMTSDAIMFDIGACVMLLWRISLQLDEAKK